MGFVIVPEEWEVMLAATMAENYPFRSAFLGVCWLMSVAGVVAQTTSNGSIVEGRTMFHNDDSRTESVKDLSRRELTETTYNSGGQLIMRKVFLLNTQGQTTQGNIYDGKGNLVARCRVFFDDFGRIQEERMSNLKGGVFQRVIHPYGPDGKPLAAQVINLDAEKPAMRSQAIDFTKLAPQPESAFTSEAVPVPPPAQGYGGNVAQPQAYQGTPNAPAAAPTAAPQEEKAKPSFWKRLFKRKDKE